MKCRHHTRCEACGTCVSCLAVLPNTKEPSTKVHNGNCPMLENQRRRYNKMEVPITMDKKLFAGPGLREYREAKGMKQAEMADLLNLVTETSVSTSSYQKWEQGATPISMSAAIQIAKALEQPISKLFVGKRENEQKLDKDQTSLDEITDEEPAEKDTSDMSYVPDEEPAAETTAEPKKKGMFGR